MLTDLACMSDYRRGFEFENECIDHFNTRLVTTLNYSAFADFHSSQIIAAHAKYFQPAVIFAD
jgi:hypothetical protein